MKIRPCIDLHGGKVKQIVGSTLNDERPEAVKENFVAEQPPSYFADLFRKDNMSGGHIIMLGPGNEDAAKEALAAWPGGFQIGGGINVDNAGMWLEKGAAAVIVTSYVFEKGKIREDRLLKLEKAVGKGRLVLDLSCKRKNGHYFIVTDRWQNFTDVEINAENLQYLSKYCSEFLVHAAHVEGKCKGIDEQLVSILAEASPIPTTYAGGARSIEDAYKVKELGRNRIDLTIGSALDIFGGSGVAYEEIVAFNRKMGNEG